MKLSSLFYLARFGIKTVVFKKKTPIVGTVIVTDRCNLRCKHCAVNNLTSVLYSYENIVRDMETLYAMGVRILFFLGGEPMLWRDGDMTLRHLVIQAKKMGFDTVTVFTNGTYPIDIPEADLIMVSLDGDRERHNLIRSESFDLVMKNVGAVTRDNICLSMAINRLNKDALRAVGKIATETKSVRAVTFNIHTPYKGTESLSLTREEKAEVFKTISEMMKEGVPVFNNKAAFPYVINNSFPRPCYQCVVIEDGKVYTCGRCIEDEGLCDECGYLFAAEYALLFSGRPKIIFGALRTYLRYL